jgi:hypothetical protein
MEKNPIIPEGWSMPEEQANTISKRLDIKNITPEDALQKGIDEIARDIVIIEPDPGEWGWWIGYLLEQLESEAKRSGRSAGFDQMIITMITAAKKSSG